MHYVIYFNFRMWAGTDMEYNVKGILMIVDGEDWSMTMEKESGFLLYPILKQ